MPAVEEEEAEEWLRLHPLQVHVLLMHRSGQNGPHAPSDEALDLAHENLRVARALGAREQEAWVRSGLGNTYIELDQPDRALEHGEAALRIFADLDHAGGQARAHTALGGAGLARHLGHVCD